MSFTIFLKTDPIPSSKSLPDLPFQNSFKVSASLPWQQSLRNYPQKSWQFVTKSSAKRKQKSRTLTKPPCDNRCLLNSFPNDVLYSIIDFLSVKELCLLQQVSRFWQLIIKEPHVWKKIALRLKIPVLDPSLHPKKELQAWKRIHKLDPEAYSLAARILGPLSPTAFIEIPYLCFIDHSDLHERWRKTSKPIVQGSHYVGGEAGYVRFIGLSIIQKSLKCRKLLIVHETQQDLSPAKKNYISRLLKHQPCGRWDSFNDTETPPLQRRGKPAVELCPPDPKYELRGWTSGYVIYFWNYTGHN